MTGFLRKRWCVSWRGALPVLMVLTAFAQAELATIAPVTHISPERPLIVLQTADAYGDRDGAPPGTDKMEEAAKHGRDVVRLWGLVPEDIREYCQLQIECRVSNHDERLDLFRRMLREMQAAEVPVSIQIADSDCRSPRPVRL